jgi:hypothetical protein
MKPLAARCRASLGMLYLRAGRREEAQGHLTAAKTMLWGMAMRYWLDKLETEVASAS